MNRPGFKIVLLPIQVPDNDYCWNGRLPCEYFDNDGGHGHCSLDIGTINYDGKQGGYKKPKKCLSLIKGGE